MPTFSGEQLHSVTTQVLQAAGVSPGDARIVADELRDANLMGHDSHGVIRLMQYVDFIHKGFVKPDGVFEVVQEDATLAIIDGNMQLGQVTATKALEVGLEKARESGMATLVLRNCYHVGRLGSYSQKAALAGFASMMCVNSPAGGGVAPFGGIERRLGTNPIAIAAPRGDRPLVLDMTSCATAEGKLRVAFQKGEKVAEGLIIDAEGNPSTDPADFYADPEGALLPLGGALGHKGFGLSVMIDLFAGILSGSGVCRTDSPRGANGVWMYLADITRFLPKAEYEAIVRQYEAHIKSSRKMPGVDEILLPGEIEYQRRAAREANGVQVAPETWRQINELAESLGVSLRGV